MPQRQLAWERSINIMTLGSVMPSFSEQFAAHVYPIAIWTANWIGINRKGKLILQAGGL